MDQTDDEDLLGQPVSTPGSKDDARPPDERGIFKTESRYQDDELGEKEQPPENLHNTTDDEHGTIRAQEVKEARDIYERLVEAATRSRFDRFNTWRRYTNRTVLLGVLASLALLALVVYAQSVQILAALAVQSSLVKALGYAGLAALLAILVVFLARLVVFFFRLRANQQLSTAQLGQLSHRAEVREMVRNNHSEAKKQLEAYLQGYPLNGFGALEAVGMLRVDEDTIKKLRAAKELLLDQDRFAGYENWLNEFQVSFQDELQKVATKVVRDWMKLVGIQTALVSKPWLDTAIVLYCSFGMIGDLCVLYNLRMTGPGAVRLLAFTLFNTYAAGQLEDVAQKVDLGELASSIAQWVHLDTLSDVALEAANAYTGGVAKPLVKVAGKVATEVGSKAADGAANAFLLNKLGQAAIKMLRPIGPR